jgi:hypothetical protein
MTGDNHKGLSLILERHDTVHSGDFAADTTIHCAHGRDSTQALHHFFYGQSTRALQITLHHYFYGKITRALQSRSDLTGQVRQLLS